MKTQSNRSKAINIFNATLPVRTTVGDRSFRKQVLDTMIVDIIGIPAGDPVTQAQVQNAAAMYNFAKKKATASGLTVPFGRAVKAVAAPVVPVGRWTVVNKVTRAVVAAAATRRAAILLRGDGETVIDSEKA